jgi:hypothetical protein
VNYPGVATKKKVLAGAPYVEPARLGRVALSWCCDLSKKQITKAKTVTSLFTLLTVLCLVFLLGINYAHRESQVSFLDLEVFPMRHSGTLSKEKDIQ